MKLFTHWMAALMAAATMHSALADGPLVIRFSHVVAPDSPKGQAAQKFANLVATRTQGKVRVDVYPNSQLYGDQDEIAALLMGSVEMLAPSLTKLKVLHTPEFEVFDLPYLFADIESAHRVTQGQIGKDLLAKLAPQGVIGLAIWDNGFKQISANRPVHMPSDVAGLSLRIQPSRILEIQMQNIGAKARPLPFSEVYNALKTGAVDGTEGPVSNFYTQNLHLTQKYLTLSNHGYLGYGVVVNRKFWDTLAPDVRNALEGSLKEATTYANDTAQRNNEEALSAVEQSGKTKVIQLSADEKLAWQKTLGKVHLQTNGRIPKELIERIYQETGYHQAAVSMR
jgi:C4-dicarboxylate-binding protein DctP